jgi:hypothetical protein
VWELGDKKAPRATPCNLGLALIFKYLRLSSSFDVDKNKSTISKRHSVTKRRKKKGKLSVKWDKMVPQNTDD